MPRPRNSIPKYSVDKNGRAFTKVCGRFISLGRDDDPESKRKYAAVLSTHASGRDASTSHVEKKKSVSVAELCLKFRTDELPRFSLAEQFCQRTAIRVLRQLFGETPVSEFGPLRLRVVRQAMVDGNPDLKDADGKPKPRKPWSRQTVNRQVKRLQAVFRWGVSWEMVPESVAASLSTIRILNAGETEAAESVPRRSVSQSDIEAVRKQLKPLHRDVLDLLTLTGARPGELIGLKMKDINRTGDIWRADLTNHKTADKQALNAVKALG